MLSIRAVSAAIIAVALAGCYHATIDTGLRPSGETVSEEWAHGFVAGLVPPSTVETASRCPNGVARVETQLSFLNQLASFLTFGIYTPMTIEVQCAEAGSGPSDAASASVEVPVDATRAERRHAVREAAVRSHETGEPVYLRFR